MSSMNSYREATADPSRSTPLLFQEGDFHLQLTDTLLLLTDLLLAVIFRSGGRTRLDAAFFAGLADPVVQGVRGYVEFASGRGDGLALVEDHRDGHLLELGFVAPRSGLGHEKRNILPTSQFKAVSPKSLDHLR